MRRKTVKAFVIVIAVGFCLCPSPGIAQKHIDPIDRVRPLMGSDSSPEVSNGNTFPSVGLPFGMNNWSPQTEPDNSGYLYRYSGHYIYGLRETHSPSVWVGDYGAFSLMPSITGAWREEQRKSWFSHKSEGATPESYAVYLPDLHAHAEVTATERAAIMKLAFAPGDKQYIVLDTIEGDSNIAVSADLMTVTGWSGMNHGGVPPGFRNYFVIRFSRPLTESKLIGADMPLENTGSVTSEHAMEVFAFSNHEQILEARIASSYISVAQAKTNLQELGSRSFEDVKKNARAIWNRELARVEVEGGGDDQEQTFYTCLYRMLIYPHMFYEVDSSGRVLHYSPYNGKVESGYLYTNSAYWDTFRAAFPFLDLMYRSLVSKIMQGQVNAVKEGGWIPEWSSPGYRNSMIGQHSTSVVADTYLHGIRGYDINVLYDALVKGSEGVGPINAVGRLGAAEYNSLGYVPSGKFNQSVSRTLEYAYDDFALMRLTSALGRPTPEIAKWHERSRSFRKLFDPETGLMRLKDASGSFVAPFDPLKWGGDYTEANAWQYTWFVPHDPGALSDLEGGQAKFLAKLDRVLSQPPLFDDSNYHRSGVLHLVREMQGEDMGQYAHNNEPMHHFLYLFDWGEPWKTQWWVRDVMDRLYTSTPEGYSGEEDTGQTSAWFVFSALGFYPVCPACEQYALGSPLFRKASLHLENGKTIVIDAAENSAANRYVQALKVDGQPVSRNWLAYSEIRNGADLRFTMSPSPNKRRGIAASDMPFSASRPERSR